MPRPFTEAQCQEAERLHREGHGPVEIAKRLGATYPGVSRMLQRRGVPVLPRYRYVVNHHFFDAIDTEAKAYWLGFFSADGNVMVGHRDVMRMELSVRDESHLQAFALALESTHPVSRLERHRKGKLLRTVRLQINTPILVAGLRQHGVFPARTKTDSLRWPATVPRPLLPHYLRGYFDGNGCWHVVPENIRQVSFMLAGNQHFLQGCKEYLQATCQAGNPTVRKTRDKVHDLRFGGIYQCRRLYHLVYDDAHIYLARKKAKVEYLDI